MMRQQPSGQTLIYMNTVFIGGAISSAIAGLLHDTAGWGGVTIYAAVLPLVGVVLWLTGATSASG